MVQIIRQTYNDDKDGSVGLSVKICLSVDNAKEVILANLNTDFDEEWKSLEDAANELNEDMQASWDNNTFSWYDCSKGETYLIAVIDEGTYQWQNIGDIR